MQIVTNRNVCGMLPDGIGELDVEGQRVDTRAGPALVMPWPVVSVYERPQERVLFDPIRDANPFFHLMESLWMLSGRDDALFLDRYVADFGERFGDGPEENRYIHGAYGHRWRTSMGFDQLDEVVRKLRLNPEDRQCVIQMWDGCGIAGHNHDLCGNWKDRPCNTHAYLRVRSKLCPRCGGSGFTGTHDYDGVCSECGGQKLDGPPMLDLTVCCRSNDVVWGAYGANAVHFSVLQEYLAGRIGVGIGKLYQFSNNYHIYLDQMKRLDGITDAIDPYSSGEVQPMPMGDEWDSWDEDLRRFMEWHDGTLWHSEHGWMRRLSLDRPYANEWFAGVAEHVAVANRLRRMGDLETATTVAGQIEAADWRRACVEWLQRRQK